MNENNKKYWENGEFYNSYVNEEFNDERKSLWKKQILQNFPLNKKLTVLDVGCGPGFFSCILAEEGHEVIGIDRSLDMLKYAKINAKALNIDAEFLQMDADKLNFENEKFDLIISRNVTWTFDNPKETYFEFYKKLRSGGSLLIYDANWHIPFYYPDLLKKVRENEKNHFIKYNKEFKVYDDDKSIFENLPLSDQWRPKWDIEVLKKLGYTNVHTNDNINKNVYKDWEEEIYSVTPLFEILAIKS